MRPGVIAMRLAALFLAGAALSGCYTVHFYRHVEAEPTTAYDKWNHSMLNGVAPLSGTVQLGEICPEGSFGEIEQQVTFLNGLANFAVQAAIAAAGTRFWNGAAIPLQTYAQVYTPTTVRVKCAKSGQPGLTFATSTPAAASAAGKETPAKPKETPPANGSTAPKKKLPRIAVMGLKPLAGVDGPTADLFTDALVGELRKSQDYQIVSPSDLTALFGYDKQKQLLGCSDASCIAEIGGAIGAERLISGSIGRLGNSLQVYITNTDVKTARAIVTVSERLKSKSDEAFLDALPRFAYQLLREPGK
jgi:hypothetical protein